MHAWRVLVDVRDLGAESADRVRVLLVADVWRRVHEDLLGNQILSVVLDDRAVTDPPWDEAFRVRPPIGRAWTEADADEMLAGPPHMTFASFSTNAALDAAPPGHQTFRVQTASFATAGSDPMALRLALLRFPAWMPARLSVARHHRAEETLQRWRRKVADWADMPSCAPPTQQLGRLNQALVDRLDTPAALTGLHRLEVEPRLASGAKFEAFVQLDRVLALDLSHLIGKLPR